MATFVFLWINTVIRRDCGFTLRTCLTSFSNDGHYKATLCFFHGGCALFSLLHALQSAYTLLHKNTWESPTGFKNISFIPKTAPNCAPTLKWIVHLFSGFMHFYEYLGHRDRSHVHHNEGTGCIILFYNTNKSDFQPQNKLKRLWWPDRNKTIHIQCLST